MILGGWVIGRRCKMPCRSVNQSRSIPPPQLYLHSLVGDMVIARGLNRGDVSINLSSRELKGLDIADFQATLTSK
jgi:hypothetical protein